MPTRFIELMNRPLVNFWARRDGKDWPWPPDSSQSKKVMLINGLAGSGGDMFPALFRQNGLGKLIGMRTWGGLVGISGNPGLIDGGYTAVPTFGYYELDGTWGIEGHGVDPDIEVIDDPALMVDGGDPQLDAAIRQVMGEVGCAFEPGRPKWPRSFGVPESDGKLRRDRESATTGVLRDARFLAIATTVGGSGVTELQPEVIENREDMPDSVLIVLPASNGRSCKHPA
ncbi:MAG: S41 family peptidase [Phycisphaerales bacterium]